MFCTARYDVEEPLTATVVSLDRAAREERYMAADRKDRVTQSLEWLIELNESSAEGGRIDLTLADDDARRKLCK